MCVCERFGELFEQEKRFRTVIATFIAMIQHILVLLIFTGALLYLGRLVYRMFTESACATGCGKCAVADMHKQMKKKATRGD